MLIRLWCWYPALKSFSGWCIQHLPAWLLVPRTTQEAGYRGEIFAGWFIPAAVALAITWIVWHVSHAGVMSGCGYNSIEECFPPYLVRDLFIHGGIAAGVGGSIHLVMLREALDRARAAEERAREATKRADRERVLADKNRELLIKERELTDYLREELNRMKAQNGNGNSQ